ncbi:MAG: hypothetical protein K9N06_08575 [Candidatus Cloacimonetes bacterium]|nr:hypothetical protein [Candidatus Cloacimonadota bacterium]
MNNALRITLIVFVLLILVGMGSNIYKKHNLNKIVLLQEKMKDYDNKIVSLDQNLSKNVEMRKRLEEVKAEVKKFDKITLDYDSPPVTFDYLINLTKRIKGDLKFNFSYSGQKSENEKIINSYLIKGTSKFKDIYKLVNHLERQQPLYYIRDLAVTAPEVTESDTISYSFMLNSISKSSQPREIKITTKDIPYDRDVDDLFTCDILVAKLAAEEARKLRNRGLFNPDGARLIGITDNQAFFRDNAGIFHVLEVGDMVQSGSVMSIDPSAGNVTFIIDKGSGKKEKIYAIESGVQK